MSEQLAARPHDPDITQPLPRVVQPPPPTPDRTGKGRRLDGLDVLRAVASLLVLYTHISPWYKLQDDPLGISTVLDEWVIGPLRLNDDFGFIGVSLFFVISGFVMAHVATKERVAEFAVKRLLRIFPGLMAAVLLAWVLVVTGALSVPVDDGESVGFDDLLANLVLANFFVDGYVPLLGVAWTLVIQLGIYAMMGALLFLFRRDAWIAVAVQITLCSVIASVTTTLDELAARSISHIGTFGTAVVLGQAIWLVWTRRVPAWAGFALGLTCWLLYAAYDAPWYGRYDDSFNQTLALAAVLVVLAVLADDRVPRLRVVTYLASRSFAVYVVHQTVAYAVLAALWPQVPSVLAVPLAVAAVLVTAELLHRAVERPCAALARRFAERRPARAA
ncbi:acyltransferase family protein [Actinophytocola gossypii]|uniref:Acyltransferase n=1 Tax=Actinophytocola gossypii TaxID=2812003 RepID=A0ABT2JFC5_9PSEU|nr:acyltransferase [Actinophytocola gossypii]MCT2586581.1 acyltransferase [Actinophytocola gossypii]